MTQRGSGIWSYTLRSAGAILFTSVPAHDHHVRLARARPEHDAEAVEVVARGAGMHHFNGTAGEAEGHRPQRSGARPVDETVDLGGQEAALRETFRTCLGRTVSNGRF